MNVVDKDEKMIGVLRLPQRLQANSLLVNSKGTVFQHDEPLEFIMISKGSAVVRDDPDVLMEKKDIRRRQPVDDVHEFYNVLWIERDKDGVASPRRPGILKSGTRKLK